MYGTILCRFVLFMCVCVCVRACVRAGQILQNFSPCDLDQSILRVGLQIQNLCLKKVAPVFKPCSSQQNAQGIWSGPLTE
jgi:hypothetical protein